jgi:diguanylate cyclase (GGDEF)-like protein/PAS domain S-box-containing protein
MPDYNRQVTNLWWLLVALGLGLLVGAIVRVSGLPWPSLTQVMLGALVAAIAGFFPLRVPHANNSFVAGEIFILLLLLLHGPEAAVVAAAAEAFVGTYRSSKRWTSRLVSPAVAVISMGVSGSLLMLALAGLKQQGWGNAGALLALTTVTALLYFFITATLIANVLRMKKGLPFSLSESFDNVGWVGITYAASACVASLLYLSFVESGVGALATASAVVAMLLATLHYYFRQQETARSAQHVQIEAAMREAEVAAKHMREMAESEQRFQSAFTHASIGMALVNMDGEVLQANKALEQIVGVAPGQLMHQRFVEHIQSDERHLLDAQLSDTRRHTIDAFTTELSLVHPSGHLVHVSLHCSFFSEAKASTPCLILQVQDITARRQAEQQLQHIAFHDGLTGLINRRRFNQVLQEAVDSLKHPAAKPFALVFIDCDRFKIINDSAGHFAGDEFLVTTAKRIQQRVRTGDVVARLGGDEFAILLRDIESNESVRQLGERLLQAMREPVKVGDVSVASTVSLGVAVSDPTYASPEDLLRDADLAMYAAKAQGKDRLVFFDNTMLEESAQRLTLEAALRQAIAKRQLTVVYQPLYQLRSGTLMGFEALCRWNHPTLGPIAPSVFIPVAEDMGAVVDITDFVLNQALGNLNTWQALHPSLASLTMHVNLSKNDIADPQLLPRVTRELKTRKVRPETVVLELTENILMENIEGSLETLFALRELGVELAIDDFGTGYSSLASLARLPIGSLKIDASFVRDLKAGNKHAEIVRSVVSLGSTLGKSVIAEGIETDSQMALLDEIGCEGGQGYLLAKPLSQTDVLRLLRDQLFKRDSKDEPGAAAAARQKTQLARTH